MGSQKILSGKNPALQIVLENIEHDFQAVVQRPVP